jgi:hypothetical protein
VKTQGPLAGIVVLACILLLSVVFTFAIKLPAGGLMRDGLRQVYAPRRVTIASFMTSGSMERCGLYTAGDDPQQWRYLSNSEGLWAEGLSAVWQSQTPAAVDLEARWDRCMRGRARGRSYNWLTHPAVAAYLNAT